MAVTVEMSLLPHQKRFLEMDKKYNIFVAGRGTGKTFSLVLKSLEITGTIFYLAPSYKFFIDTLIPIYEKLNRLVFEKTGKNILKSSNISRMELRVNNALIKLRSVENFEKLRGISAKYLFIDEGCYISKDAFNVLSIAARERGCRVYIVSSPAGKTNWLYEFIKTHKTHIGYISKVPTYENTFLDEEYLEGLAETYTSNMFQQEILGKWISPSAFIHMEWIKRKEFDIHARKMFRVIGIDPAPSTSDKADYTAFAVCDKLSSSEYQMKISRSKYSFANMIATIATMAELYQPNVILIENMTFQNFIVQECQRQGIKNVIGVSPTGQKIERAMPFAMALEKGFLTIDAEDAVINEIVDFPDSIHDDTVDAAAYSMAYLLKSKTFNVIKFGEKG